jgi:dTDP-glucose pyrophosphorylase
MGHNYKFCILAAGKGSRCTTIKGIHKALLPLENKSVISHILEKIHPDIEIVIAIGYKSEQLKTFINTVHTDRKITFVDIEDVDKPGSGPGASLLACSPHLQCPFIFTSGDTITEEHYFFPNLTQNWVGYSEVDIKKSSIFCLVEGETDLSKFYYGYGEKAFIGMAGIHDYEIFWNTLSDGTSLIKNEKQVISGFEDLLDVKLRYFKWYDTGNNESYKKAKNRFCNDIVPNKNDEILFIENNKVIKYFADKEKVDKRIKRLEYLNGSCPSVTRVNDNMYSYKYIPGRIIAAIYDEKILKELIPFWLKQIGSKRFEKSKEFLSDCISMYHDKTFKRCEFFMNKEIDNIEFINGIRVKPINNMLNEINWDKIYETAIPSYFHGDITPENVLYSINDQKFVLIDWRESFGKSLEIGDFYYDLGKLHHSLLINNTDIVQHKMYKVKTYKNEAFISNHTRSNLLYLLNELEDICVKEDISFEHIELLSILQYLGIASLYENFQNGEYGKFLFLYGKYLLAKHLKYDKTIN